MCTISAGDEGRGGDEIDEERWPFGDSPHAGDGGDPGLPGEWECIDDWQGPGPIPSRRVPVPIVSATEMAAYQLLLPVIDDPQVADLVGLGVTPFDVSSYQAADPSATWAEIYALAFWSVSLDDVARYQDVVPEITLGQICQLVHFDH